MKEIRQYQQFFKESSDVRRPENNTYAFDLTFEVEPKYGKLMIPDCGGMTDMLPLSPLQATWVKQLMQQIEHKKVWGTIWKLLNRKAYDKTVAAIEATEAELKKFYLEAEAQALEEVLTYVQQYDLQPKHCQYPSVDSSWPQKIELSAAFYSKKKQLDSWEELNALFGTKHLQADTKIRWIMV